MITAFILLTLQKDVTQKDVTVHEFIFKAPTKVAKVNLAGTFNNWDKDAQAMKEDADGKTWRLKLSLPYGKHQYKFVLDGSNWILDPMATKNESDGGGNINSVLVVLPPDYATPANPNDGVIAASALRHEQELPWINYDKGQIELRFRARANDLASVWVDCGGIRRPMNLLTTDELYSTYNVKLKWDLKDDLAYRFQLRDGDKIAEFGSKGLDNPARFVLKAKEFKPFTVPSWVEKTVIYQIFPDRFANGSTQNDPKDVVPWDGKPTYSNRFGGDAIGVDQKIPYLKDLGIKAIYFTPVFQSPSNHRYDATDYKKIDPEFGTNQEFFKLTKDLKTAGISTVMDFAFNHTATNFYGFEDLKKNGADSKFRNWYYPKSFPIEVKENPNYVAWFNYPSMPKLNTLNPETTQYLLSVLDFWKANGSLEGIRLDTGNEVDSRFWKLMRTHVKKNDPATWIVGEVWGDGNPWLKGDQWDSVMNYRFRDACVRFFAEKNTNAEEFMNSLTSLYNSYVPQVSRNMMNLLSSHDTPRFLTLCKGDQRLQKLAATVQFTWVGAPSIYYGEELGMEGDRDPDNRRAMRWDIANSSNAMLEFYKKLIHLRESKPALQSGEPVTLFADRVANVFAYARVDDSGDFLVVVGNRSTESKTISFLLPERVAASSMLSQGMIDTLTGAKVSLTGRTINLTIPPLEASVLAPASNGLGSKSTKQRSHSSLVTHSLKIPHWSK